MAVPPSSLYTTDYFLSGACEGLEEYLAGGLSALKQRELQILDVQPGHCVLDLGCGRGEASRALRHVGARIVSLDYSPDAVRLTKAGDDTAPTVVQGNAIALPFQSASFDRVLVSDVIEHLPRPAAVVALREVQRVLAPNGRAVIHTSPNTWFIALVLPPLRVLLRLLRRRDVLERFAAYDRLRGEMHPNELNPLSIRRLAKSAGVSATTWVDPDVLRSGQSAWTIRLAASPLVRLAGHIAGIWPLRLVLGNDLFVLLQAEPLSMPALRERSA
jgi:SAM-dependent methyltransferase